MTIPLVDYILIAAVLAVVLIRIVTDIRETVQLQRLTRLAYVLARQNFSPSLTIILPVESLEDTKQTIEHLQSADYPATVLAVINSTQQPRTAGALRYFLKKQTISHTKVVAHKQPDLSKIAATRASGELIVVLPDTARLHESFYRSAILPFGDPTVAIVKLMPHVRPSNTITSALETLHLAWVHYMWWLPKTTTTPGQLEEEGVVRRSQFKKPATVTTVNYTQKTAYSRAPKQTMRRAWPHAISSVGLAEYTTVLFLAGAVLLALFATHNALLMFAVAMLLLIALAWWALARTQLSAATRSQIILLAPVFFITLCVAVVTHAARFGTGKLLNRD